MTAPTESDPVVPHEPSNPDTTSDDAVASETAARQTPAASEVPVVRGEDAEPEATAAPTGPVAPEEQAASAETASSEEPAASAETASSEEPAASAEKAGAGDDEPWGRVDERGVVSVREASEWRVVGEFPDGSAEEALAYFERKFTDLASEVALVEVRHRRSGASATDLRHTVKTLRGKIVGAAAVGDLESLMRRLDALQGSLSEASAAENAAAREAVDAAIAQRTELVELAEALAGRDPRTVQWKQATTDMSVLFDRWQAQQQSGPRLPKAVGQQLWKRFREARAIVDKNRREFYAGLDETHKVVRDAKARLVERAEALAPKGEDGIAAYRDLLDEWKSAGRAGKRADDALWARFKAAGDALYAARADRESAELEASVEKIAAKQALLDEAKTIVDEPELARARQLLSAVQRRWDDIGRIAPRDRERALDDELRKIEQTVRSREDADWKRNNPETKARANDMTRQLVDAIEKLQLELDAATKAGDKKAAAAASEAIAARRTWLKAVGG